MRSADSEFRESHCFYWASICFITGVSVAVFRLVLGSTAMISLSHVLFYGFMVLAAGLFVMGLLSLLYGSEPGTEEREMQPMGRISTK